MTEVFGAAAPVISGVAASQTISGGVALRPFAAASMVDANNGATDALSIVVSGGGVLSGSGLTSVGGGVYTVSGSAASGDVGAGWGGVHADLRRGEHQQRDRVHADRCQRGGRPAATVNAVVTDVFAAVAPSIAGTSGGQATVSEAPVRPFAGVTIGDANQAATDTVSIGVSGRGVLSGGGLVSLGGGNYAVSGTAAAVTSALDTLVFTPGMGTPAANATTVFTLTERSSAFATARERQHDQRGRYQSGGDAYHHRALSAASAYPTMIRTRCFSQQQSVIQISARPIF